MNKNILVMLVGMPMSGKSTFWKNAKTLQFEHTKNMEHYRISSDDFVEKAARTLWSTYSEVFKAVYPFAEKAMYVQLDSYLNMETKNGMVLTWDQTNLTVNSRIKKLKKIPDDWKKIAIVFPTPGEIELNARKEERKTEGKHIDDEALSNLNKFFSVPSASEGFDEIYWYINDTLKQITED